MTAPVGQGSAVGQDPGGGAEPAEPAGTRLPAADRVLAGWGRTAATRATVVRPEGGDDVVRSLADAAGRRGAVARGLARSYNDAAQNAGGTVLDTRDLDEVGVVDPTTGVVVVGAGVTLDALMRRLLPRGWFVPVTPGTRQVTVGGAVAADVHGKNHHVAGSFTRSVEWLDLRTPDGELRRVSREQDPDAFHATCGGMGLTGVVERAAVRMHPVRTSWMTVDTERAHDLDDLMARLESTDHRYRYSVAWLDTLASGRSLGRAVLTRGDHAEPDRLSGRAARDPQGFDPPSRLRTPSLVPPGLLNRLTVRAFNEAYYRVAPEERRDEVQSLAQFFHPLDAVVDWNRLYGSGGFVQYQLLVPFGAEAALREALERLSAARSPAFLAVLKRFGPGDPGHLSFPAPGWTLALDVGTRMAGLEALLDGLDELVVAAGGRVYLAKDARLRPELLGAMYPRLDEWRAVRARLDPDGVLRSDLSRRLGL